MLADVIAALGTPPGRGAVAVIRVTGDGCFDVAGQVIDPWPPPAPRMATRCRLRRPSDGELLDDAVVTMFVRPASYTGQDLVEISTHGGSAVYVDVLGALFEAGAREAFPGEFTRRAVANGKMDLLEAEAVGDLVDASTTAQRRAALSQLQRGLSHRIDELRAAVLELEALMSYAIDFPEEDSGPVPPERITEALDAVRADVGRLLASADTGERIRTGALAAIAGRPNVGKSSLFNALVGSERAIVTDIPGTTRDALETLVQCAGYPFRLVDTAGMRETEDVVERLGIDMSRRFVDEADVVLLCVDGTREIDEDERAFLEEMGNRGLLVRTKCDLAAETPEHGRPTAALHHTGIEELGQAMADLAFTHPPAAASEPRVTRERHRVALALGLSELDAFAQARVDGVEAVMAATHLRAAVTALEDIVGVVSTEDVLDRVFASFCIGK